MIMHVVIFFVTVISQGHSFESRRKDENSNDLKYVLQALSTLEDRLVKLEDLQINQGIKQIILSFCKKNSNYHYCLNKNMFYSKLQHP